METEALRRMVAVLPDACNVERSGNVNNGSPKCMSKDSLESSFGLL